MHPEDERTNERTNEAKMEDCEVGFLNSAEANPFEIMEFSQLIYESN